jgi:hypothetical protein
MDQFLDLDNLEKHPLYLEHHRALGYLTDLSFLANECHTDLSPVHPSTRPPSPSRAHHGEPPAALLPKSGSPSTGLTRRPLPRRPPVDRICPVGHQHRMGFPLPCFFDHRPKCPRELGRLAEQA